MSSNALNEAHEGPPQMDDGYFDSLIEQDSDNDAARTKPPANDTQLEPRDYSFRFISVGDVISQASRKVDWLVRDFLEQQSFAVLLGDPKAGKSFIAIDWSCCVATEREWCEQPTSKGAVFYLAGEGHAGLGRRVSAWCMQNHVEPSALSESLFFSATSAPLCDPEYSLIVGNAVENLTTKHGKPALIVVDTLARNFGADENSTADMNQFVAAIDQLRNRFGCAVLVVHHSGHGDKSRGRGSSALRAAIDFEYLVSRDDRTVSMKATAVRDHDEPEPLSFELVPHKVGVDGEGGPVFSAALEQTEYREPTKAPKVVGSTQQKLLKALIELEQAHAATLGEAGYDGTTAKITLDDWRAKAINEELVKSRQHFSQVKNELIKKHVVIVEQGFIRSVNNA